MWLQAKVRSRAYPGTPRKASYKSFNRVYPDFRLAAHASYCAASDAVKLCRLADNGKQIYEAFDKINVHIGLIDHVQRYRLSSSQ